VTGARELNKANGEEEKEGLEIDKRERVEGEEKHTTQN